MSLDQRDRSHGRFLVGLLQSLGVAALGVVAMGVVLYGPGNSFGGTEVARVTAAPAAIALLALGIWHLWRGRRRSAAGVLTGTVVWFAIGLAVFAVVAAFVGLMSHIYVPW